MNEDKSTINPNCFSCRHLKITYHPHFPRACLIFGFKGQDLPSVTVKKTTGQSCPVFTPKVTHKE